MNEENSRSQELLHFSSSTYGDLVVHRGKSMGEQQDAGRPSLRRSRSLTRHAVSSSPTGVSKRLGRHVYCGFEVNSGEFAVIYEWVLHWNKKSKFFTSQEKGRIEACKKQVSTGGRK